MFDTCLLDSMRACMSDHRDREVFSYPTAALRGEGSDHISHGAEKMKARRRTNINP